MSGDRASDAPLVRERSLALIVAIARNGVIGRAGGLPFDWPEDRAYFEEKTRGHVVVMGRRTFEETGHALPNRVNVVVSRTLAPAPPDVTVVPTLDDALAFAWARDPEPFVIGGASLYAEAMPHITRAYVTEIPESPDGDTRFAFDARDFRVTEARTTESGLRFVVYARMRDSTSGAISVP